MKRISIVLMATILLTACEPLQNAYRQYSGGSSSSASKIQSTSSVASPERVELPVEIEEVSSSSVATGSGALAERVAERGMLEIGNQTAPLLLTIFTNYSCDYCEEFMRDMLPRLESAFMVNGKLRMQFVIVPLKKYPNSALEASALLCASALEKGQVMHEAIRGTKLHDRTSLLALAKKTGVPSQQFTTCLIAKETKNLLAEQQTFIAEHDVTLIPTFIIDDEKKTGLLSYADLRGWIRERLAK